MRITDVDKEKYRQAREGMRQDPTYPCNTCPRDSKCISYCTEAKKWFCGKNGWQKTVEPFVALHAILDNRRKQDVIRKWKEEEEARKNMARSEVYWHEMQTGKLHDYKTVVKLLKDVYHVEEGDIDEELPNYFIKTTTPIIYRTEDIKQKPFNIEDYLGTDKELNDEVCVQTDDREDE